MNSLSEALRPEWGGRAESSAAASIEAAAKVAIVDSLKLSEGESLLIVTNPLREVLEIAGALYDAAAEAGARPTLIVQPVKTQTDYAEEAVISAFDARPDAFISLSAEKLGKDREGIRTPYEWDGVSYDHIFHYQLHGAKTLRAFWSPGITKEMFAKTLPIDYRQLKARCQALSKALAGAVSVRITNEKGCDISIGLKGRAPKSDDGDFSSPGSGGNLPAGEVFVSPELGTSSGVIVFDGSIAAVKGDIVIQEPIRCRVEGGRVVEVTGGAEAAALLAAIQAGEDSAKKLAREGALSSEKAEAYERNARSLGELGIGLNPAAAIVGNMLEDEKAFRTCHFAIGSNYDEDAPAMIHLDGLVTRPTIVITKDDGKKLVIEREGELQL
jgi:aminopeptidase